MTPAQFRRRFPALLHFTREIDVRLGLLTASQILDKCADKRGVVSARFYAEQEFRECHKDHWKETSRFLRDAGEHGSRLLVRDSANPSVTHTLGNNYPLGDGTCLGTTIPFTDNRPGDAPPTPQQWLRLLNEMFWVFPSTKVNEGFVDRLRVGDPGRVLHCVSINTGSLENEELTQSIRMSRINGGGSNGAARRGTATYKTIVDWQGGPIREIGIQQGLTASRCEKLLESGGITITTYE